MQELTVDPRLCGVEVDELAIGNIAAIESYLTTFAWNPSDPRMSNPIWVCRVTPQLDSYFNGIAFACVQPTAMSFAVAPFLYWHGTIKYRFEIVASSYHRGKIAIGMDPNIAQYALIVSSIEMNKNFLYIMDIQETQSVELCVEWTQPHAWAIVENSNDTRLNYGPSFTPLYRADAPLFGNGFIYVTPFTELTSPNGSSVSINVYVSCDDLMVQQPDYINMPTQRSILTESANYHDNNYDMEVDCFSFVKSNVDKSGMCLHHFGEQPLSFRSLMKRYVTTHYYDAGASALDYRILLVTGNNIESPSPTYGGAALVLPANIAQYLRYAFLAVRGGSRKRVHIFGWQSATTELNSLGALNRATVTLGASAAPGAGSAVWDNNPIYCTLRGSVSFVPQTNGGIEFELPFYSPNLFNFSFSDDGIGSGNTTGDMITNWSSQYVLKVEVDNRSASHYDVTVEHAVAEDFTFFRYMGAPMFTCTL